MIYNIPGHNPAVDGDPSSCKYDTLTIPTPCERELAAFRSVTAVLRAALAREIKDKNSSLERAAWIDRFFTQICPSNNSPICMNE